MTIEQMKKRIAELQQMAKQHEAILLQISGAIQEFQRIVGEAEAQESAPSQETSHAAD